MQDDDGKGSQDQTDFIDASSQAEDEWEQEEEDQLVGAVVKMVLEEDGSSVQEQEVECPAAKPVGNISQTRRANDGLEDDLEYKTRITMYTMEVSNNDNDDDDSNDNDPMDNTTSPLPPVADDGIMITPEEYKARICMYAATTTDDSNNINTDNNKIAGGTAVSINGPTTNNGDDNTLDGKMQMKLETANEDFRTKIIEAFAANGDDIMQRSSADEAEAEEVVGEEEEEEDAPAPLRLQRIQQPLNRLGIAQPGAYPHRPGGQLEPLADMAGDLQIGDPDAAAAAAAAAAAIGGTSSNDDGLVEANLVIEEERPQDMMEAQPVDLEEQAEAERQRTEATKSQTFRSMLGVLAAVIVLIVLVVGLGLGLKQRSEDELSSHQSSVQAPTAAPDSNITDEGPGVLDDLVEVLPNYTLAGLVDPDSIQSKAFEWLLHHQRVTELPQWRKVQLFALGCLYFALDGPNWPFGLNNDWLDDTRSECYWFSNLHGNFKGNTSDLLQYSGSQNPDRQQQVCNEREEFQIIDFKGGADYPIKHTPSLPLETALLTSLKILRIHKHNFLNQSSFLDLFPRELATLMTNLKVLQLDRNRMYGTVGIPTEYGLMTSLTVLRMNINEIHGTLPSELGLLNKLERLILQRNHFTGTIPMELCQIPNLTKLQLSSNNLGGTLPSELGLLMQLNVLDLNGNLFVGSLPTQIGLLTNLRQLNLQQNSLLSGPIPSQFGLLTNLKTLNHDLTT